MAVDGQMKTFWASKYDDTAEPVEFLVDLGRIHTLHDMEVFWEFPARVFSVSLSTDGSHFTEVFATDANVMPTSRLALGGSEGRKVRIAMKEVRRSAGHESVDRLRSNGLRDLRTLCLFCWIAASSNGCNVCCLFVKLCVNFVLRCLRVRFQGHRLYGIRAVSVYAQGLRAVVSDCGKAAKSSDARDKYFLTAATEFDEAPAKSFLSELPALESARAALAPDIAELSNALPKLESCGTHAFPRQLAFQKLGQMRKQIVARGSSASSLSAFDTEDLDVILKAARSTIISIRGALA